MEPNITTIIPTAATTVVDPPKAPGAAPVGSVVEVGSGGVVGSVMLPVMVGIPVLTMPSGIMVVIGAESTTKTWSGFFGALPVLVTVFTTLYDV